MLFYGPKNTHLHRYNSTCTPSWLTWTVFCPGPSRLMLGQSPMGLVEPVGAILGFPYRWQSLMKSLCSGLLWKDSMWCHTMPIYICHFTQIARYALNTSIKDSLPHTHPNTTPSCDEGYRLALVFVHAATCRGVLTRRDLLPNARGAQKRPAQTSLRSSSTCCARQPSHARIEITSSH